jgi:hypothetical protein
LGCPKVAESWCFLSLRIIGFLKTSAWESFKSSCCAWISQALMLPNLVALSVAVFWILNSLIQRLTLGGQLKSSSCAWISQESNSAKFSVLLQVFWCEKLHFQSLSKINLRFAFRLKIFLGCFCIWNL